MAARLKHLAFEHPPVDAFDAHRTAGGLARAPRVDHLLRHPKALRMHVMLFDIVHAHGLKCACAHVQSHVMDGHAFVF